MQETVGVKGFLFNVVRDKNGKPVRVARLKNNLQSLFKIISSATFLFPFYDSNSGGAVAAGWKLEIEEVFLETEPVLAGMALVNVTALNGYIYTLVPASVSPNPSYNISLTASNSFFTNPSMIFARYSGTGGITGSSTECRVTEYSHSHFKVEAYFIINTGFSVRNIAAFSRRWRYSDSYYISSGGSIYVPLMLREFVSTLSAGQSVQVSWTVQIS